MGFISIGTTSWTANKVIRLDIQCIDSSLFAVCNTPNKNIKGIYNYGVVWILAAAMEDFRTNTEQFGTLSNKITKIFRPKVVSRRISAQAGAFTVHKINEGGKIIKFESHNVFSHKLTKVEIQGKKFAEIRKSLTILGINHFTVVPDLDGFCKHLQWRLSKLEDESIPNFIPGNTSHYILAGLFALK
jgi:hypothetical protein